MTTTIRKTPNWRISNPTKDSKSKRLKSTRNTIPLRPLPTPLKRIWMIPATVCISSPSWSPSTRRPPSRRTTGRFPSIFRTLKSSPIPSYSPFPTDMPSKNCRRTPVSYARPSTAACSSRASWWAISFPFPTVSPWRRPRSFRTVIRTSAFSGKRRRASKRAPSS